MEFLTNPWFIVVTVVIIAVLTYLAIKFYYKSKDEPLLFDRLKDAEINITIRKPIKENTPIEKTPV